MPERRPKCEKSCDHQIKSPAIVTAGGLNSFRPFSDDLVSIYNCGLHTKSDLKIKSLPVITKNMDSKKYCVGYMDTFQEIGVWNEIVIYSEISKNSKSDPPNVKPQTFSLDEAKLKLKELRSRGQNGFLFEHIYPNYLE